MTRWRGTATPPRSAASRVPTGEPSADWKRRHVERQQQLLRRLASEVHSGIEVETPCGQPPTLVRLSGLNVDATSGNLVLWGDETTATGQARALPPTPDALNRRVLAWVEDAEKYDEATPENSAAILAWEDEGSAIARELQQMFGDDYRVVAY